MPPEAATPARARSGRSRAHLALAGAVAALAAVTASAVPAGPPPVDLDAFERSEQLAALPNGVTLGYVDRGPRDGQPVVLIHGFTNNARNWAPLLPYLDPKLRLILVDLRGHGKSSTPECCYDRIDLAYDIRLLLEALGIGAADIVGHSLGSIVAQTFAEYWPDRTRRVVLIASSGGSRPGCPASARGPAFNVQDFRNEVAKLKDPIDPNSKFMDDWYGLATTTDEELLRRQRRDAAAIPAHVWLAIIDQVLVRRDLQATLPMLKAPALLIWGGQDSIIGAEARCSLHRALPGARIKLFPDLGHNPFWQDPSAVAAVVNPFLAAAR
jgi:pimeloyl-ACP methyl ester carboxylesterase